MNLPNRIARKIATTIAMFLFATLLLFASHAEAQNSNRKIRVKPNAIAAKIGTAIAWQTSFEKARELSTESGKPIFWYPPRLPRTFMDRKKEIDRYMRAGLFSAQSIVASINEHYIPLMAIPDEKQAEAYNLKPFEFVEPGFLVIAPDGSKSMMLDRITTMNSKWIASFLKPASEQSEVDPMVTKARERFVAGDYSEVISMPDSKLVEVELLRAMAMFRSNQHELAYKKFADVGTAFPNHPLGWKAAAEGQGFGPFVRGFETFRQLPAAAYDAGRKSVGSAASAGVYSESDMWCRGIEYLLSMQHENGSFRDSDYDYGGTDGLPNVHVAVTSIAAMALLESLERPECNDQRERIRAAIDAASVYVANDLNLNPKDSDEIFWAYLYRLRLFNRLQKKNSDSMPEIAKCLASLEGIQTAGGDWYHEYKNPFVTASALWAMSESKSLGAKVSASAVEAGSAALKKCRYVNGAYSYSAARSNQTFADKEARPRQVGGAAGRGPLCEGALYVWDQSTDDLLLESLNKSLADHDDMAKALKYDDHTASYNYGGFFYWYCMQARSETILKVADRDQRTHLAGEQRKIIMAVPELDGCFVDSHEIGRCYGTAMALLCLTDCERATKAAPEN